MIGVKPKRFWKKANVGTQDGGFEVRLDTRPLRTPAKAPLIVPSRALADAIAAEWDAQEDIVNPATMPLTRSANSAIDKVVPQHQAVARMIAEYGGTDLICYRATGPEGLVQRQTESWDPWVDWAAREMKAPLISVAGVMHKPQPAESLERLYAGILAEDPFPLTALHDLVVLSGSLILGLAVRHGALGIEEGWNLSRVDETWQEEQWGQDAEAAGAAAAKRADFVNAADFLRLAEAEDD